ncbi:hypothetical protein DL93DRAFT_290948 [Clavulina sp. PMI_390]|nr:hypothetical protein DL93DRAFT_290948 [Clavulina sp. PMI_390]
MRPPTPNLSSILSAAYIRDPSLSPTRIESPIDTLAQYLNIPDHQEDTTIISEDSELTPTMQYASLPPTTVSSYSPLLQHQREQQLQALQQQQCIPGLSQIYSPLAAASLSAASYGVVPSSVLSQEPVRSPSLSRDDSDIADDDYVPSASLITRKRPSVASQKAAAAAEEDDEEEESSSAPPPPKRQRAAPSGPISTKDWVPPDVTGLNKREARLVKNRAAAFLSRQRKREEFEQMEMYVSFRFINIFHFSRFLFRLSPQFWNFYLARVTACYILGPPGRSGDRQKFN